MDSPTDGPLSRAVRTLDGPRPTPREAIDRAAGWLAETIGHHRVIGVFGAGRSHIFGEKPCYRAGGLVPVNAMRPLHHREPGALGAVMYFDQIVAELIADRIHVHPAAIAILLRVKGLNRVALVSDAAPMAGLPDGEYEWEHKPVYVRDGACRLGDGTIAGAHALIDQGIRVLCREVGLPLQSALVPATQVPAEAVGAAHLGRLAPGCAADLTLLDPEFRPVRTFIAGRQVWPAPDPP